MSSFPFAVFGMSAPTEKIAHDAGVAEDTLFTHFANKDELLNPLSRCSRVSGFGPRWG
jgi:hypothetical protein